VLRSFVPSSEEQIRKAIDTLKSVDLSKTSVDELKEQITVLLKGHHISAPAFFPSISLRRARKMNTLPMFLNEIGAPPPDKVRYDQRCNRAGQSLFYCCAARNAPFFEVHAKVGHQLVLSEWRTRINVTVNHVGYTRSNFVHLQSTRECPNWSSSTPTPQPTNEARLIDEFFASLFCVDVQPGQEHLYRATIALTEKLIPEPTEPGAVQFDGVMYPTIPMSGNCENFALKPEFIQRGVEFVKAEYVRIRAVDGMVMTFDTLDFANSVRADGALDWRGRPGHWVLRGKGEQLRFGVNEQGEWEARVVLPSKTGHLN